MKTWIHFIGKEYYKTPREFINEAKAVGVTRRVSRKQLRQMNYGDRVMLAMNDGKSSILIGKFIVSVISGMSSEESAMLADEVTLIPVSAGGMVVNRGCGSYCQGPTFVMKERKSISEVLDIVEEAKEKGKMMVGGEYQPVKKVRLKSMRLSRGFRPFNYEKFLAASQNKQTVSGFFYMKGEDSGNVITLDEHNVQTVSGYNRK